MMEAKSSFHRWRHFGQALADWLAAATLLSLPWSTSATSILVILFAIAVLASASREDLSDGWSRPSALWTVGLWILACLGLLWSEAAWADRLEGLRGFHKLLLIPLVMLQFRRSPNGIKVLTTLLVSLVALQIASWLSWHWPQLTTHGRPAGVPVKDTIYQGVFFGLAAAVFASLAVAGWTKGRRWMGAGSGLLAGLFIVNLIFVATSRTALVVTPVLLAIVGAQTYGRRGVLVGVLVCVAMAAVAWVASPYLQQRVSAIIEHVESPAADTSERLRMAFWQNSLVAMKAAPVLGHGTGSVETVFGKIATGEMAKTSVTQNPHNQTLLVGVQLGLVGIAVLYAMWLAHLLLFMQAGWIGRMGVLIVMQNIVSSFFNSHLSDFTAGWLYVLGVGILGGMVLRQKDMRRRAALDETSRRTLAAES